MPDAVRSKHSPRATVVAAAVFAAASLFWQGSPARPVVTIAADPLPTPTVDPLATPNPTPTPDITPAPSPTPDPTAEPSPTLLPPTPDPTALPSPDPSASPDTTASPDPLASPSPSPSAEPTASPIEWQLSSGQRPGGTVARPIPLYRLVGSDLPLDPSPTAVHSGAGLSGPTCAACHSTHTAAAENLVNESEPDPNLCYRCHAGAGSPFDVRTGIAAAPTNDPDSDAYYRHTVGADPADDNRTSACLDCHNPHDATALRPQNSTTGWTASGDIRGANGQQVANRAAADAPQYTLISRSVGGASLTYEYELCLNCHSGAAALPTRSSTHPSWWALDKGIELNPANNSYHPIEAAGRNGTAQMAASLAGTSPYKRWQFSIDSTVRCTNCHADPASLTNDAAAYSPPHASANRGLLVAPYRDRLLKPAGEAYQASDFALCYLCHAEAPFKDPNTNPATDPDLAAFTTFPLHGDHLTALSPIGGTGGSIDTAGAGQGLAICAECHFRIHSTAIAYKSGDLAPKARDTNYGGLVNFAPNVGGVGIDDPTWLSPDAAGSGSCTLTCHGYEHSTAPYTTAPAAAFTASATEVTAGTQVDFSDKSLYIDPLAASWAWTFGDGTTSAVRNPSHAYAVGGTYTVTLTVTRTAEGLFSTLTRTDFITVAP